MIKSYKDLEVYTRSYKIALEINLLVKKFPQEEIFGITSQMKRASLSIPLNIAEGYGKKASSLEFKRFLVMAMGSSNEMCVLVSFAKDMKYITLEKHEQLSQEYEELGKMLNSMISKWK
jgi:four helix bundle protein